MKKLIYILSFSLCCLVGLILLPTYTNTYRSALELLPNYLQKQYIGFVLSPKTSVFRTDATKIGLLEVLGNTTLTYDANLLIPLCKRGEGELLEPIPQKATNLIINHHAPVIPSLKQFYKNDSLTTALINEKSP